MRASQWAPVLSVVLPLARRAVVASILGVLSLGLLPGSAFAQTPLFTFEALSAPLYYDPAVGTGTAHVSFTIAESPSNPGFPNSVTGWSMSITHDPAYLSVQSHTLAPFFATLNSGQGPDFAGPAVYADGFTIGVVHSFSLMDDCIFEVPKEVLMIAYTAVPGALLGDMDGETLPIVLESGPGIPPVANLVVQLGFGGPPSVISGFVNATPGSPPPMFLRGDTDGSGSIAAIADGIWLLAYLFNSGPLDCLDAGDVNDDGSINLVDPIDIFNYGFVSGPPPQPPFPTCGDDPTPDAFDCVASACP